MGFPSEFCYAVWRGKLEWYGYPMVEKCWWYVYLFWQNFTNVMDTQTDGRTDIAWRHRPRLRSIARQKYSTYMHTVNCNGRTSYASYFTCSIWPEGPFLFQFILGHVISGFIDKLRSVVHGSPQWPACCTSALAQGGVARCSKQLEAW